jgi:hypothetical protein
MKTGPRLLIRDFTEPAVEAIISLFGDRERE